MSLSSNRIEYIHAEQNRAIHDMQRSSEQWRRSGCFWDSRYAEFNAAQERFTALNIIHCVMRHSAESDMEPLIKTVQQLVKP